MPNLKTLPARVKASTGTAGDGLVEALVATYDVDSSGDRIVPGAFTKSLDEWGASDDRIPFIWSHMHNDLDAYLGEVLEAKETEEGLWVKAQLDMDDPKAAKAFRLIKGGRVRNYSFAYEVVDGGPADDEEKQKAGGETLLRELKLYEVGPCLIGMNQQTRTLVAKSLALKEAVSDAPWEDFPDSAFDDEQYARSCVLDRGEEAGTAKERFSLPCREPDGTLNRNAVHAAAAALSGGRGGVDATDEQKADAARKLLTYYRESLDEDPPESLVELAGEAPQETDEEDEESTSTSSRPPVGEKAGRVLSAKNESNLREAADLIIAVLKQLDRDQEKTSDETGPTTDKEPQKGATAKESNRSTPVNRLAAQLHLLKQKGTQP